jgi:hypothetical protein
MTPDMPGTEHDDSQLWQRVRNRRLQEIATHVDRIERELDGIASLVASIQQDDTDPLETDVRGMQRPGDRSVTSDLWPMPTDRGQELGTQTASDVRQDAQGDSASL